MKKIVIVLVMGVMVTGISFGAVYEDFEDGDYTSDPAWILTNSTGDSAIVNDPIRSDNLVLSAYGNAASQRVLETYFDDTTPWLGFNFSVEFSSSTDWYHPYFRLGGGGYEMRLELLRAYASQDIRFRVSETGVSTHDSHPYFPSPIDEWWRLNLWHDTETGFVNAEIRLADDNTLLAEQSFLPSSAMATAQDISYMRIEVGEPDVQYFDNIVLTPEPATLSLFAIGAILLRRRRAYTCK